MTLDLWIALGLLILVSAVIIAAGLLKKAGSGLLIAIALLAIAVLFHKLDVPLLGFTRPADWLTTILLGGVLGTLIALLATVVIEPIAEKIANERVQWGALERLRGKDKQWAIIMTAAWVGTAVLEETVFRGFLMTTLGNIIGYSGVFASINLGISAILFGIIRWYQGKGGVLRAIVVGLLLGNLFIHTNYNLWMPILAHIVISLFEVSFVSNNTDVRLKKIFWKDV